MLAFSGTFIAVIFIIVCVLLIIAVVLFQKGRGGGMGSALGGQDSGNSFLGTRTGDFLTWVTVVLTALFLFLAVAAVYAFRPEPIQLDKPVFGQPRTDAKAKKTSVYISKRGYPKGASIHYTTDGSAPTQETREYSRRAIELKLGMTVKAKAFMNSTRWTPSETSVFVYEIAKKKPTTATAPASIPASSPASQAVPPVADPVSPRPESEKKPISGTPGLGTETKPVDSEK